MTPDEFVNALRQVVLEQSVDTTLSAVEHPPGRRPSRELVEASVWYSRLTEEDRAQVRAIAAMVAHDAVFGMLAVLDGARAVESTPTKGRFHLTFHKDGKTWDLSPPDGVPLHDLLNAEDVRKLQ